MRYPWGSSERIDGGDNFEVNHIVVNPGATLAVRAQNHHTNRWVVVSGTGQITRNSETFGLRETESYDLTDTAHLLKNSGNVPLRIIEIQTTPSPLMLSEAKNLT
jgi:mannose-6-phosphate isomerase-like protein (cupin superfamily)